MRPTDRLSSPTQLGRGERAYIIDKQQLGGIERSDVTRARLVQQTSTHVCATGILSFDILPYVFSAPPDEAMRGRMSIQIYLYIACGSRQPKYVDLVGVSLICVGLIGVSLTVYI